MQKKLLIFIQIALVISSVLSTCKEGCLKCDIDRDYCLLCDLKTGYQTVRGRCVYAQQKNCAIQNYKGNCMRCDPGYFVDSLTYTCVESSKAGSVENCEEYLVDNQCTKCKTSFYLTAQNKCMEFSNPIQNCRVYQRQGVCKKCQSGFQMSMDQSKCFTPPTLNKCASFSPVKCVQCDDGYVENKNNYLYMLMTFQNNYNYRFYQDRSLIETDEIDYLQGFNQCQALTVPNCKVHSNFKTCVKCNDNYFLQLGKCVKFPEPKIYNCVRYSSLSVCIECVQGMFLKTEQECVKVTNVNECVTYDPSEGLTNCLECQKDFYLSEPNVCSKRTGVSQISFCNLLDKKSESCLQCEDGYTLTSDLKKCLPSLENCKQYELSDSNSQLHQCQVCVDGYYYDLNKKTCEQGSIEKCQTYYRNSNTCELCVNKFYLTGGQCKNHDELKYCNVFENNQKHTCKTCNSRTLLFERQNTCLPVVPIQYCDIYQTTTECQKCVNGYELTQDKKCSEIPKNQFCFQKVGPKCIQCIGNYILENGMCKLPLHHLIRNCDDHNTNGLNSYADFKCKFCREFFIPVNFKQSFVCYENEYIQSQLQFATISNCLKYRKIQNIYQCQKCDKGYLLHNNTCLLGNTCPSDTTLRLQTIQQVDSNGDGSFDSFYVDKINECGDNIKNCEIAAPDLNQNLTTVSYSCTKCRQNAISVVTFKDDVILSKPNSKSPSPLSHTPSRSCEGKLTSQLLGEIKDNIVQQCDLYYELNDFGYGCLRCMHGYQGLVVNLVYNCKLYSSLTTCVQCNQYFYPKTSYRCERVKAVQYCQKYEDNTTQGKCIECLNDFILDYSTQTCSKRTQFLENCQKYNPQSNVCMECKNEWQLVNDTTNYKCIRKIEGCTAYDFTTQNCTTCQDDWYIYNNLCYKGKVSNCAKYYDTNLINRCLTCENQFYLTKNNTCEAQPSITGCDKYLQEQGYCKQCVNNSFLFLTPKKCIQTVTIDKCTEFQSYESCKKCQDGFYPVNYGQRCLAIPNDKNCLIWGTLTQNTSHDENNCLKCKPGYLLINKSCRKWFDSISKYCVQENDLEDGKRTHVKCKYCDIDQLTLNDDIATNNGVCLESDLLKYYSSTKMIDNCIIYNYSNDNFTCNKCAENYYLYYTGTASEQTECLTESACKGKLDIPNTIYPYLIKKYKGAKGTTLSLVPAMMVDVCYIGGATTFETIPYTYYCTITSYLDLSGTFSYGCAKCPDNKISEVAVLTAGTPRMQSPITQVFNSQWGINITKCLNPTSLTILGKINGQGIIKNCEYYAMGTNYTCVSCKMGYRGLIKTDATDHYIEECEAFTDCDSTTPYDTIYSSSVITNFTGDGLDLNVLFRGCQKCTATGKAVTAFVNATFGLKQYDKTNFGNVGGITAGNYGYNITCQANTDTVSTATTLSFISNCGKVVVDVAGSTFICVSCLPGFFPTRDGTDGEKITACTAFANCQNKTYENVCAQCNTGYVYEYDTTNSIVSYDKDCINTPTPQDNCFSQSTNGACMLCNKGYQKIKIGGVDKCIKNEIANCTTHHTNSSTTMTAKQLEFINNNYDYKPNFCAKCDTGFVNLTGYNSYMDNLVQNDIAPNFLQHNQICYKTEQVYYDDQKPTPGTAYNMCNNKYSNYLLNTNNPLDIHCRECQTTAPAGVITLDGKCVLQSDNQNCLVVKKSTNNYCDKCSSGYISVAGVCQLETTLDQNCAEFADTTFKTGSLCSKCKDYYYLESKIQDGKYVTQCIKYYPTGETPSVTTKPIKNCAQFNSDNLDKLYCIQCESMYALLILKGDEVGGSEGNNRKCIKVESVMNQLNCKTLELSDQQNGQLVCKECKDFTTTQQYFLISKNLQASNESYNNCVEWNPDTNCENYEVDTTLDRIYLQKTYSFNYLPKFSTLKCTKCKNTHWLQQDTNKCQLRVNTYSNKCKRYEIFQDYCAECESNYFLSSTRTDCLPAPINTKPQGHLYSCKEMKECNRDVMYEGIHPHLEQIFSCHKCKIDGQIPFAAVSGGVSFDKITQINAWGLDFAVGKTYKDVMGERSVFCAQPQNTSFNIDTNKWQFPSNCALGVLNVDSQPDASSSVSLTAIDRTKIAVFCGSCQPGYKPVYGTDTTTTKVDFAIVKCELITNCEESNAVNSCTKCKTGYGFGYQNNEVNYQECVALPTIKNFVNNDCYSYDSTNSKCMYCCKGTYLNKDNFCERINPPKCEFGQFNYRDIFDIKNLNTGLYLNNEGTGCNKCEDGYSGIFMEMNYWICTESIVHKRVALPTNSQYINNCKNYEVKNNLLKCVKCYDEFIPIDSTGICTAQTTDLEQCVIAQDATFCLICSQDYVLVNRKCEKKNIDKCEIYTYDDKSQYQVCTECELGYYLDANRCYSGEVQNCLRFETKIVCNTCKDGFHLVKRNNGVSYCYPIDKSLNCQEYHFNDFQQAKLTCTKCIHNEFVISSDKSLFYKTHCLRFFETNNCVKYNTKPAVADSSFECIQCTPQFFIQNKICEIRQTILPQCEIYTIGKDECEKCKFGYYASTDGKTCIEYPTGIKNCRLYTSKYNCQSCIENHYLQGDYCIPIKEEEKISNCRYYVDKFNCDQCVVGFQLKDKRCIEILAKDCAVLESINSCASCPTMYGFEEVNGVKSCVAATVPNCLKIDPVLVPEFTQKYKCLTCSPLFYPGVDGVCLPTTETIFNCEVYDTIDTCSKCNRLFALSLDKKQCLGNRMVFNYLDLKCKQTEVLDELLCNSCEQGYIFSEDERSCVPCETNHESCYNCDPLNIKKCLLCNSGYVMNQKGECVMLDEVVDPVKPQPEPEIPESLEILKILLNFVWILLL